MARTVAEEVYGNAIEATGLSSTYRLRLPMLANGARLYDLSSTGAIDVVLPSADFLAVGSHLYAVANKGSFTLTIKAADASTTICTVAAGNLVILHLVDDSTSNGTWRYETVASVGRGGTLTAGRVPMTLRLLNNSSTSVVLRDLADLEGYTGDYPLALRVEVGTGTDPVIRGSQLRTSPALATGQFFAGTTILILQRGVLTGCGGNGGTGGTAGSGAGGPGEAGGTAFFAQHDCRVLNFGTISGGGGGGGGGAGAASATGGGGGGGAGQRPGYGGSGGSTAAANGSNGAAQSGGAGGAGQTGASTGGAGGGPGAVGTAGSGTNGGAGGAAGYSLRALGCTITLTNLGTINGPQVLS